MPVMMLGSRSRPACSRKVAGSSVCPARGINATSAPQIKTAKVSVRNARRDAIDALKKAVKDGMAEDEQKNSEAKLQKVHDKYIKQIDDLYAAKDKEIMTV